MRSRPDRTKQRREWKKKDRDKLIGICRIKKILIK